MGFLNGNPPLSKTASEVITAVAGVWRDGIGSASRQLRGPYCCATGITGPFRSCSKSGTPAKDSLVASWLRWVGSFHPGEPRGVQCISCEASWRSFVSLPHFTKKEIEAIWPEARVGVLTASLVVVPFPKTKCDSWHSLKSC